LKPVTPKRWKISYGREGVPRLSKETDLSKISEWREGVPPFKGDSPLEDI
jgi:hypothetical protein